MTVEIQFVPGEFQSFRAITQIHLGKLASNLAKDETVGFDGQTLKLGGVEHHYPELRAGVRAGWLVPIVDNISSYRSQPSTQRRVSTVSEDDTLVGPARRPPVVRESPEDSGREVARFQVKQEDVGTRLDIAPARHDQRKSSASMKETGMDGLNEGATSVGKIRTSATQKTVLSDAGAAAQEVAKLDNTPPPRAVLASKGHVLATKTGVHAVVVDNLQEIPDALDPSARAKLIAGQRKTQVAKSEAKVAPVTVAKSETAAPVKLQAPPQTVEEFVIRDGLVEIYPGVHWDKALHWRTRAKIALDQYGNNPGALAAIKAFETPAVVRLIDANAGRKT